MEHLGINFFDLATIIRCPRRLETPSFLHQNATEKTPFADPHRHNCSSWASKLQEQNMSSGHANYNSATTTLHTISIKNGKWFIVSIVKLKQVQHNPNTNRNTPKLTCPLKRVISKGKSSSNHYFSGDIRSFMHLYGPACLKTSFWASLKFSKNYFLRRWDGLKAFHVPIGPIF